MQALDLRFDEHVQAWRRAFPFNGARMAMVVWVIVLSLV
jgi:hypothetical protein